MSAELHDRDNRSLNLINSAINLRPRLRYEGAHPLDETRSTWESAKCEQITADAAKRRRGELQTIFLGLA